MERIRIPNDATYAPLSLLDVALTAPMVSRLLFRASLPGRAIQVAALGIYFGSAAQDWWERRGVRKIDFLRVYGADVRHLDEMPEETRRQEVRRLVEEANDGFTAERLPRPELAAEVDRHLTDYIAGITGQRVETSTEIRSFAVAQLIFPFALGACDFLSGDVAIFKDTGVFEPHVVAHEFAHRKGYWKELEAQALAYFANAASGNPILEQSARCERVHRHLRVLAGDDPDRYPTEVADAGLRSELEKHFTGIRPVPGAVAAKVETLMKRLYDERMRLTGQNGIQDYDLGFTNFLYTFERSSSAQRPAPEAVS
ncbi:MAG: DUF3810 family protein [Gemmatimonas sp.]|nr:DUF3810 family protein [Gemmatimonas sp.]